MIIDEARPRPQPGSEHAPVFDGYERRQLSIDHCRACGSAMLPIGPSCLFCGSDDLTRELVTKSLRGIVYSVSVSTRGFLDFRESAPYTVVLVDVPSLPRLRLVGNLIPSPPPQRWRDIIGRQVQSIWVNYRGDLVLPQWTYVGEHASSTSSSTRPA